MTHVSLRIADSNETGATRLYARPLPQAARAPRRGASRPIPQGTSTMIPIDVVPSADDEVAEPPRASGAPPCETAPSGRSRTMTKLAGAQLDYRLPAVPQAPEAAAPSRPPVRRGAIALCLLMVLVAEVAAHWHPFA